MQQQVVTKAYSIHLYLQQDMIYQIDSSMLGCSHMKDKRKLIMSY